MHTKLFHNAVLSNECGREMVCDFLVRAEWGDLVRLGKQTTEFNLSGEVIHSCCWARKMELQKIWTFVNVPYLNITEDCNNHLTCHIYTCHDQDDIMEH